MSLYIVPWHIIQRGNNRSACFYAEEDYYRYLDTLKEQAEKYGCLVHAYVLMTNHVAALMHPCIHASAALEHPCSAHLLLTPEKEQSASLLMKHLGQRYVQYINRTYKRSGTLWPLLRVLALAAFVIPFTSGGRHKASLVNVEE